MHNDRDADAAGRFLSTPSLGITEPMDSSASRATRSPFNSLSRDHLIRAVGATELIYLSFNSLSRDHYFVPEIFDGKGSSTLLSTPSLGITRIETSRRVLAPKLSTPSLGITLRVVHVQRNEAVKTFNSLSRDHLSRALGGASVSCGRPFNSLSRDHVVKWSCHVMSPSSSDFQLPLSGSLGDPGTV